MPSVPSTDVFAVVGVVPALANNTVEATPGSGAPELLVAAGAGDATKIVGNTIDRNSYGMPDSAMLAVQAYLNLADTETFSLAVEIQESDDASTWDTAEAIQASTVVKTADGAFTDLHTESYKVYLGDRKRYVRFNVTPDFSASSTDTGTLHAVCCLAGGNDLSKLPGHQANDE